MKTIYENKKTGVRAELIEVMEDGTMLHILDGKDEGKDKKYTVLTMKKAWKVIEEQDPEEETETVEVEAEVETALVSYGTYATGEEYIKQLLEQYDLEAPEEPEQEIKTEEVAPNPELEKALVRLHEFQKNAGMENDKEFKDLESVVLEAELILADYYVATSENYAKWKADKKVWISEAGKLKRFIKKYK